MNARRRQRSSLEEFQAWNLPPDLLRILPPDVRKRIAKVRTTLLRDTRVDRKLARELITAGYRALALKCHPDQGGSTAAMIRLTRVREVFTREFGLGRVR
jgi:hypothetical protein